MISYMKYKYFNFGEYDSIPGAKTKRFLCRGSSSTLGIVKWYGLWRAYVFYPHADTLFNASCLADIQDFLNKLMEERKDIKKEEKDD